MSMDKKHQAKLKVPMIAFEGKFIYRIIINIYKEQDPPHTYTMSMLKISRYCVLRYTSGDLHTLIQDHVNLSSNLNYLSHHVYLVVNMKVQQYEQDIFY